MTEKTRGIVISSTRYNDASRIVTLYTERFGRVPFMAHGITRGKKPARTALFQPLMILNIEASFDSGREVQQIRNYSPAYLPVSTSSSVKKSAIAMFIAEVLNSALREEPDDLAIFNFLESSVKYLDNCNSGIANFHLLFLLKLTQFLGFAPAVRDKEGDYFLDLENGLFTTTPPQSKQYAKPSESRLITELIKTPFEKSDNVSISPYERRDIIGIILKYYTLHISGFSRIKSATILSEVFE